MPAASDSEAPRHPLVVGEEERRHERPQPEQESELFGR